MTDSLVIGIPVLARPQNAAKVAESIRTTAPDAEIMFITSRGDKAEITACKQLASDAAIDVITVGGKTDSGQFAAKHNEGLRVAIGRGATWYFCGADDLLFHPNWFEQCIAKHLQTGACVIGTNDLHNQNVVRGWYATHMLVHTDYLECGTIDEPGKILHEGYDHQSVDIEFCQTARFRGTYAHAVNARVEHLHVHWGLAEMDDTYTKALRATHADQALLRSRQHLWGKR